MIKVEDLKKKHKEILKVDLGEELAEYYVEGLYEVIVNGQSVNNIEHLKEEGSKVFYKLAKYVYGPLMCAFVDWILKSKINASKKGKIIFMARDATPLYFIAQELLKYSSYDGLTKNDISLVYFTRKIAGESDEIANFKAKTIEDQLLAQYLKENSVNEDSLIVDMGLYGTLYNKGCGLYWKDKPKVVFLYSKNPNILGFLNLVCGDYKEEMLEPKKNLANLIVDGLECIPQKYWSPGELVWNGKLAPKLEKINDEFIQEWNKAFMKGVLDATQKYVLNGKIKIEEVLGTIDFLSSLAKSGEWTGILPNITPEWSLKNDFLNNTRNYKKKTGKEGWKVGIAPPLNQEDFESYKKTLEVILN